MPSSSKDRLQGQLDNLKAQTWAITGYGVALLAGIYGIGRTEAELLSWERWSLVVAAVSIPIYATILLLAIQSDIKTTRLLLDPDDASADRRGSSFLVACIGTLWGAAVLAAWSSIREAII